MAMTSSFSFWSWLCRCLAWVACAGVFSCKAAGPADWQEMPLAGAGTLRLRHAHALTAVDTPAATATAGTLLRWSRDRAWSPMRVEVDDTHPLVVRLKAGPLLVLVPDDRALPVVWVSLAGKPFRALLEDRATGALTLCDLPAGQALNLSWLGL